MVKVKSTYGKVNENPTKYLSMVVVNKVCMTKEERAKERAWLLEKPERAVKSGDVISSEIYNSYSRVEDIKDERRDFEC